MNIDHRPDTPTNSGGGPAPLGRLPALARFNAWANGRLDESIDRLDDEAYRRDRGLFFGSIHRTLNHLLAVDRLWTGRIAGTDHGIGTLDQQLHDDRAALKAARLAEADRLIAFVDALDPAALDRPVRFRTVARDAELEMMAGDILIGLFNHQTHHRGQIHAALTQLGIEPAAMDFIDYLFDVGEVRRVG